MSAQQAALEQSEQLRAQVNVAYSAMARAPSGTHPFPIGRKLAEDIGYPAELLDTLPQLCVEAFAGVSKVSVVADLPEGAAVLDLGCGAGMDSIIAARRVGPAGRVIGVDFSETMLARAAAAKDLADVPQLDFHRADAENLFLADNSVDVALVNGIFNLNPARSQILSELARVLRRRGRAYVAELILARPLPEADRTTESNWFA
jgi:SAM-dependent methyltransferase